MKVSPVPTCTLGCRAVVITREGPRECAVADEAFVGLESSKALIAPRILHGPGNQQVTTQVPCPTICCLLSRHTHRQCGYCERANDFLG